MIVPIVEPDLERDLLEEGALHREEEAVRACREVAPELVDASIGVGVAARDEIGPAIERHAHAVDRTPDRGVEHVRRERGRHGGGC